MSNDQDDVAGVVRMLNESEAARQAREWDEYWGHFEVVEGDSDA